MSGVVKSNRKKLLHNDILWDGDSAFFQKEKRREFVNSHPPLSDQEFLARCQIPGKLEAYALAVRKAMARVCHVNAESIFPETTPPELIALIFQWDDLDFLIQLETQLQVMIPETFEFPSFTAWFQIEMNHNNPLAFGGWTLKVASALAEKLGDL